LAGFIWNQALVFGPFVVGLILLGVAVARNRTDASAAAALGLLGVTIVLAWFVSTRVGVVAQGFLIPAKPSVISARRMIGLTILGYGPDLLVGLGFLLFSRRLVPALISALPPTWAARLSDERSVALCANGLEWFGAYAAAVAVVQLTLNSGLLSGLLP